MATEVLEAIAKAECHLIAEPCPACAAARRLGPVAVKLAAALGDVRAQFLSDDGACSVGWPKQMRDGVDEALDAFVAAVNDG